LIFHDAGTDVIVVTAHPSEIGGPEWPDETSTVIRFHQKRSPPHNEAAAQTHLQA
jgi:hypothetical protein